MFYGVLSMYHVVNMRTWVFIVVIVAAGWQENTASAQLFSGRRQQCCPQKTCKPLGTPPKAAAIICMIDELYASEGYYLYYAHFHEDGSDCPEYTGVIAEAYEEHSPLPEICDNCDEPGSRSVSLIGLPAPIATDEALAEYMRASKATKLEELAGNLELPNGRKIHARIGIFKVTAKVKNDAGQEKEVTEYFGFGFEAEDTGKNEFHAIEIGAHDLGSIPQKYLTEFKIGTLQCVVLTVK